MVCFTSASVCPNRFVALVLSICLSIIAIQDPDMLKIGAGCLTLDQEKSQMALWCILAAPLLIGSDLRKYVFVVTYLVARARYGATTLLFVCPVYIVYFTVM